MPRGEKVLITQDQKPVAELVAVPATATPRSLDREERCSQSSSNMTITSMTSNSTWTEADRGPDRPSTYDV